MRLSRREGQWLEAMVDALLPAGCGRLPSGLESKAVPEIKEYLGNAPFLMALGFRLTVWMTQFYPLFVYRRRFTSLDVRQREYILSKLYYHRLYLFRQLTLFMKTMVCFGYGDDPAFKGAIGYSPDGFVQEGNRKHPVQEMSDQAGGKIFTPQDVYDDWIDEADFVIVGSGAAGGSAAQELTLRGFDVVMVEEGPFVKTEDFVPAVVPSLQRLYRDQGNTVMMGRSVIPYLQGCVVGGSTTINSAIIWRAPEDLLELWSRSYGLKGVFRPEELDSLYDLIEEDLSVRPVQEDVRGEVNRLLKEGCERLEYEGRVILRNENGCRGTGRCGQGCPVGAKKSTDLTYIPWSVGRGMRLYTLCRADRLLIERGVARGVVISIREKLENRRIRSKKIILRARRGVILAASAVQTPLILRASGVKRGGVGENFQAHPGTAPIAIFDSPVEMWKGATQGYECHHFRQSLGIKFEVVNLPPELAMVRLPGAGREFMENLLNYEHAAIAGVQCRAQASGKVRGGPFGSRITFTPTKFDMERIRAGVKIIAEVMFAAGAKEVIPGIQGMPKNIGRDQLRLFERASVDPRAYTIIANHLFSSTRMGPDPSTSVVGTDFQCHDLPGCYVVDSSIFPTNIGCNPQHMIMAVARLASRRISETTSGRLAA